MRSDRGLVAAVPMKEWSGGWRQTCGWTLGMHEYGSFWHKTELTSGWVNCDKRCVLPCLSSHRGKMILSTLGSGLHDLPRDNVYSSSKFNLCVFLFCGPYCRFSVETFLDSLMTGIDVYLGRKKVRWLNWHNQVKCITKNTQRYELNIQPANGKTTVCPKW